ncbi:MAG: DUF2207 domain-containing protein [Candidatus Micrarchaeota archaeon]|nr:DUF2207 domain-containing protein [Candidatus Micrarchaeota archaeon]
MKRLLLFLLVVALAGAKNYSLLQANLQYTIKEDGWVSVQERIVYELSGCFNELYLSKPPELIIKNATGHCLNLNCTFEKRAPEEAPSHMQELVLLLPPGENCNKTVRAIFQYEVKALRKNADHVQFFYKLWGEGWDKYVHLYVDVVLPGNVSEVVYFLHPWDEDYDVEEKGNKIHIYNFQPPHTFLEINLLMPLDWFLPNASYLETTNITKAEIIAIEEKEKQQHEFLQEVGSILGLLYLALGILALPFFYWKYGREYTAKELGYIQVYERYPPEEISPTKAAFYALGRTTSTSIPALIMMLVYKGYLDLEDDKIKILEPKHPKPLSQDEKHMYYFLKKYAKDGELSLEELRKIARDEDAAEELRDILSEGVEDAKKDLDLSGSKKYMFTYFAYFMLGFLLMLLFPHAVFYVILGIFIYLITYFIAVFKPLLLGRWNREGRLKNLRWQAFKRYLSDMTLLKEKPPSSIALWDLLLVYAVALGVADKTLKAMKVVLGKKLSHLNRPLYRLAASPSFVKGLSSLPSQGRSGRSFGGSGGGIGGGGGGAR